MKKIIPLILVLAMLSPAYAYMPEKIGYGDYRVVGVNVCKTERIRYEKCGNMVIGYREFQYIDGGWGEYGRKVNHCSKSHIEWLPDVSELVKPMIPDGWDIECEASDGIGIYEKDGFGSMFISLFTYDAEKFNPFNGSQNKKGIDMFNGEHFVLSDYEKQLSHKKTYKNAVYGYLPMEETPDVFMRGYIPKKDYIIQVEMTNCDDFLTDAQKKAFVEEIEYLAE